MNLSIKFEYSSIKSNHCSPTIIHTLQLLYYEPYFTLLWQNLEETNTSKALLLLSFERLENGLILEEGSFVIIGAI